jgi:hypothetical protein
MTQRTKWTGVTKVAAAVISPAFRTLSAQNWRTETPRLLTEVAANIPAVDTAIADVRIPKAKTT